MCHWYWYPLNRIQASTNEENIKELNTDNKIKYTLNQFINGKILRYNI